MFFMDLITLGVNHFLTKLLLLELSISKIFSPRPKHTLSTCSAITDGISWKIFLYRVRIVVRLLSSEEAAGTREEEGALLFSWLHRESALQVQEHRQCS